MKRYPSADWSWKYPEGADPVISKKKLLKKAKVKKKKPRKDMFYMSDEWRSLRYKALVKFGRQCQCCGAKPPNVVLHVDHIKPRSKFPNLALRLDNLQILCEDCNLGKRNRDMTDFRR